VNILLGMLVVINDYYINSYWWILMVINVIKLVVIGGYFINGYWWLFRYKSLVVILLMVIDG
jgi:hypothetical protein